MIKVILRVQRTRTAPKPAAGARKKIGIETMGLHLQKQPTMMKEVALHPIPQYSALPPQMQSMRSWKVPMKRMMENYMSSTMRQLKTAVILATDLKALTNTQHVEPCVPCVDNTTACIRTMEKAA